MNKHMILIFGGTGDLTRSKLMPALYSLYLKGVVSENTPIVGLAIEQFSRENYVNFLNLEKTIPSVKEEKLEGFLNLVHYYPLDILGGVHTGLPEFLKKIDAKHDCCGNKIFYLAIPPQLFINAVDVIHSSGLLSGKGWKRLLVEKPFGYDLESARQLNDYISSIFDEKDIYRIDHYLGKELVQSILVFRFVNAIFEQIWNNQFIDNIQITLAETVGVGTRAGYFDGVGTLRDMIQNHLLQVLALVAMEPPRSMDADSIRDEKVRVFNSLRRVSPEDIVVGQYSAGVIDGEQVVSYLEEPNVPQDSKTETYASLKVFIDNDRFRGVPFYMRTGKRLKKRFSEVNVILKNVSCDLFARGKIIPEQNTITLRIQPHEGISIKFNTKAPGPGI